MNLRWGKVVAWGLVAVAGAGTLMALFFLFPGWHTARGDGPGPGVAREEKESPRLKRLAEDTLLVPPEVQPALGLRTVAVVAATRPRALPSLTGTLALDTNRLVRIHSRFPGEVVQLGTTAEYDPSAGGGPASSGRTLRYGDSVHKGQLLAVVWSKDLGEKKSELVDAASKLKLDREVHERLRGLFKEGGTSERNVREAERAVEADLIAVARAERTLRSWRLGEDEIAAVRAEAERLGRRASAADEAWARVEVRSPQDGVILEKNLSQGDLVDTTTDLFKIADLSTLAVWAHAYAEDLPALQALALPTEWTVKMPSRPGVVFAGRLEQIGKVIDPNQHTALVFGRVENAFGELRVGQFVTAEVKLPPTPGEVEVPTTALVEDGRTSILFVQPDSTKPVFVRRRVRVVRRFQDVIYLLSEPRPVREGGPQPIRPGEHVVAGGAVLLNEAIEDLPVTK
ncbi:MAG: efflux RND transporter periplasmic adaptor subunit [Planctomycetes bacterium]|nr:efflux RND transporter periplasmic adaptor subunit [Planctomycetota bacterium]